MRRANPFWGAPRIHGELLKIGIEVSQATVAKYMVRRVGTTFANMAQLFAQRSNWHRRHRNVRRRVSLVSTALRHDHPDAQSQKDCAVRCYVASHGGVAFAAGN